MSKNGVFLILPTEICYSIVSYLDPEDAAAFAKCSRHCYSLTFRARFGGIKLHDDNYKRFLKSFTGSGWLAPFKYYIRSMTFTIFTLDTLDDLHSAASVFPNIQSLTVKIFSFSIFQGNVYSALFWLLSTLPFYDDINHFAFIWAGTEERWYNDIENYRLLPESEKSTLGLYKWTMRQFPKVQDLLGPYIPEDVFVQKMAEIRLPKNLQSFQTDIKLDNYNYLLPILNSTNITTLHIHRATHPFVTTLEFPTVKNLTLNLNSSLICYQDGLGLLRDQFPNLESLKITNALWEKSVGYIFWFPNVPTITQLDIPWPGLTPHNCRTNALEHFLSPMLNEGNHRNLERCAFRGITYSVAGPRDVVASCTISKKRTQDPDFPGKL